MKSYLFYYKKLTTPLANNKKAGAHSKKEGIVKNIARIIITAANKSRTLKTSPLKTKRPFVNSNKAQRRIILPGKSIPKINIINKTDATKSRPPNILTIIELRRGMH